MDVNAARPTSSGWSCAGAGHTRDGDRYQDYQWAAAQQIRDLYRDGVTTCTTVGWRRDRSFHGRAALVDQGARLGAGRGRARPSVRRPSIVYLAARAACSGY